MIKWHRRVSHMKWHINFINNYNIIIKHTSSKMTHTKCLWHFKWHPQKRFILFYISSCITFSITRHALCAIHNRIDSTTNDLHERSTLRSMFQSLKQLNHLRLYQNTQQLDTSSFLHFVQSVFQIVPRWFWGYIILVSIVFPFEIGKEPFFVPLSSPPIMTQLVHLYTFIVMILYPITLTYIRFVKSISFTRFYWGLIKLEDRFTERHNQWIREKRQSLRRWSIRA